MTSTRDVQWFLVGYDVGHHVATALAGTFADGYAIGHADGVTAGRRQLEGELEAEHAALWVRVQRTFGGRGLPLLDAGVKLLGATREDAP